MRARPRAALVSTQPGAGWADRRGMTVELLRRRDRDTALQSESEPSALRVPAKGAAQAEGTNGRALERLDRWIEEGDRHEDPSAGRSVAAERSLTAGIFSRQGRSWVRMLASAEAKKAARETAQLAGSRARAAGAKVARLFAEKGERGARTAVANVQHRALLNVSRTIPARVQAHVLEHTREIVGKPTHTLFREGMSMGEIQTLVRTVVAQRPQPVLSVSSNGALAFVFEKELPAVIGRSGEKLLRVVVNLEGRLVTAFPVGAGSALRSLTVRGLAVAATVAPVLFMNALAESESELAVADAERRSAQAKTSLFEDAVGLLSPYGVCESTTLGIEPNFGAIRSRSKAALDEARSTLGRELMPDEQHAITQIVTQTWTEAAVGGGRES